MAAGRDPRIGAYIARAKPFARPILKRIRAVVHRARPGAQETLKWGMPTFVHRGKILCGMAAFKAHAALWFWNTAGLRRAGILPRGKLGAMGNFGRLTKLSDLPSAARLVAVVRKAAALIDRAVPVRR